MDFRNAVQKLIREMEPEFFEIYHHCHENPELSFQEYDTTAYIRNMLTGLGIGIQELPGLETGVVGVLRGEAGPGPCVALRADIDGLPIEEASSSPCPSRRPGVMHACGHDIHYASLLCAAKVLAALRKEIRGSVKFLFQPAEEVNLGAQRMVSLGCLQNPRVSAVFGLHNSPEIPLGTVAVKDGPLMASADRIEITIHGRGGHGGIPQRNVDPIVAAAAIVQSLQTIVSRNLGPVEPAVVSICNIQAGYGSVNNVCPDEAKMYGTVRAYRQATRALIDKRIHEIAENVAAAYGATADVNYIYQLPVTDNTRRPGWPDLFRIATAAVLGAGAQPVDPEPSGGGEDFSIYCEGFGGQQGVPGFFYWLGVRNEATGCVHSWHSPHFKADDACIPIGAGVYALSALEALEALAEP